MCQIPQLLPSKLLVYHKPAGLITTEWDPEGRPTVFDKLKDRGFPRLLSIGRLDFNTEGLLLLTTDGALKRYLELPSTGLVRKYRARVRGIIRKDFIARLRHGMHIDGVTYGPVNISVEEVRSSNTWLQVSLCEGKVCTAISDHVHEHMLRIVKFGEFLQRLGYRYRS